MAIPLRDKIYVFSENMVSMMIFSAEDEEFLDEFKYITMPDTVNPNAVALGTNYVYTCSRKKE